MAWLGGFNVCVVLSGRFACHIPSHKTSRLTAHAQPPLSFFSLGRGFFLDLTFQLGQRMISRGPGEASIFFPRVIGRVWICAVFFLARVCHAS